MLHIMHHLLLAYSPQYVRFFALFIVKSLATSALEGFGFAC